MACKDERVLEPLLEVEGIVSCFARVILLDIQADVIDPNICALHSRATQNFL